MHTEPLLVLTVRMERGEFRAHLTFNTTEGGSRFWGGEDVQKIVAPIVGDLETFARTKREAE